jgi:hypothetical protein
MEYRGRDTKSQVIEMVRCIAKIIQKKGIFGRALHDGPGDHEKRLQAVQLLGVMGRKDESWLDSSV